MSVSVYPSKPRSSSTLLALAAVKISMYRPLPGATVAGAGVVVDVGTMMLGCWFRAVSKYSNAPYICPTSGNVPVKRPELGLRPSSRMQSAYEHIHIIESTNTRTIFGAICEYAPRVPARISAFAHV